MGMSTNITAFIQDSDPNYQRHKKVLLACSEAKVSLPRKRLNILDLKVRHLIY